VILLLGIFLAAFVLDTPWSIVVLVAAILLEPVEIAFLRRWSKRMDRTTEATTGMEAMIGKRAEVVRECRPRGTVRLDGELWEAHCDGGAAPGDKVRVESVDQLTLRVARTGQ
jgi:membrane protein implicated in regulation of membrane protease activity